MHGPWRGCLAACLLGAALSPAQAEPKCASVFGTRKEALVTAKCESPVGFCTEGTIAGNRGLRGVSTFSAIAFDPVPSDPLGRLAVSGTSTYTTADGVLTIGEVLAFDVEAGTLGGTGRIVNATADYTGATGSLMVTGRVSEDGASLTLEVTGELCLP